MIDKNQVKNLTKKQLYIYIYIYTNSSYKSSSSKAEAISSLPDKPYISF